MKDIFTHFLTKILIIKVSQIKFIID